MIVWLTGLSGSGKTTLARHLIGVWRKRADNVVLVDGDEVRNLLGLNQGKDRYTLDGRRRIAEQIHNLCAWLDRQDIHVVCSTISLFKDLHDQNRQVFSDYFEVYLSVPMDVLYERDNKNLYAPALKGDIKNVIGVDLPFTPPANPDMTIDNSVHRTDFEPLAAEILDNALKSAKGQPGQ